MEAVRSVEQKNEPRAEFVLLGNGAVVNASARR